MVQVKKGRLSFVDFLNRELPALGLTHWHTEDVFFGDYSSSHEVGTVVTEQHRFLLFKWTTTRKVAVASIIAEPESPADSGAKVALSIRVSIGAALPALQQLARKFETDFGVRAELVY